MKRTSSLALALFLLVASESVLPAVEPEPEARPRLLLLVVVDQLRFDYLTRFKERFQGGLKRFLEQGASFQQARHAHAVTTTGPGHAALATGTHPSRSGIIDNAWYDRREGKSVNCVGDPESPALESSGPGRSPRNLLRDGIGDWMKIQNPRSRVFAASRKDRGAILPGGRRADAAYWYDPETGRFVTSRHYLSDYPAWVQEFNARRLPDGWFGRQWTALDENRQETAEPAGAEIWAADEGVFSGPGLPRTLGSPSLLPDEDFYAGFGATPLMDEYLEAFAEALVENESLGADDDLDLLALSFSALDSVGHDYGPNSRQARDALLRLDRTLGKLLEFLDRKLGAGRVAAALSADHGVMGVPELLASHGQSARRLSDEDRLCVQRAGLRLLERLGPGDWFLQGLYLNYETVGRKNWRRSEVEAALAEELQRCDAVERVWTRSQLESDKGGLRLEQYRRSFHPERSPDAYIQWKEGVIRYGGRGTTHGSPYEYDVRVPLVILAPGLPPQSIDQPVWTVDLGPTLAGLLGIQFPADLDGTDRGGLLRSQLKVGSGKQEVGKRGGE